MKYELSLEKWKETLNLGKKYGVESILVTGGEFIMRDDSIEILNFALNNQFKTNVLSNGYKINSLEKNILEKLQKVQISLDSSNSLVHDLQRGEGSWNMAMNTINYLEKNKIPTEISATISPENINELKGLAKLAYKTNSKLLLRPLLNIGRNKNGRDLIKEQLFEFENSKKEIENIYGKIFIEDFASYVPINGKDHDKINLEKGIITLLPNGNLRGLHKNISLLPEVLAA